MSRPIRIAPSILAANFSKLGQEVTDVIEAGADWVHLDVMDGHFVPNISFGAPIVKALRGATTLPFDVHLMIAPADTYIADFVAAGADRITVHCEAGPHLHRSLQAIRAHGKYAGAAINPGTPAEHVLGVLDLLDTINVLTVNPGFGGQAFLDSQLRKIAVLRQAIDASGRQIALQVDGGINAVTARRAVQAGADTLVAGTDIFGAPDYAAAIAALHGAAARWA